MASRDAQNDNKYFSGTQNERNNDVCRVITIWGPNEVTTLLTVKIVNKIAQSKPRCNQFENYRKYFLKPKVNYPDPCLDPRLRTQLSLLNPKLFEWMEGHERSLDYGDEVLFLPLLFQISFKITPVQVSQVSNIGILWIGWIGSEGSLYYGTDLHEQPFILQGLLSISV